jgi:hypothetical protein
MARTNDDPRRERAIHSRSPHSLQIEAVHLERGDARATEPSRAEALRRTVLLWDHEMAQRLLVELFLLPQDRSNPAGEPPPAGTWPLRDDEKPATPDYLPASAADLGRCGVLSWELPGSPADGRPA